MRGKPSVGLTPAVLAALSSLVMIVAVVIMVKGSEEAAILIALVTPIVTTILSVSKLNNVQQEMGEQTAKLNAVQSEVTELGNGKMTATVKQAVHEAVTEVTGELPVRGGESDRRSSL